MSNTERWVDLLFGNLVGFSAVVVLLLVILGGIGLALFFVVRSRRP